MTVSPTDHRYLQVARTLRKEIVDGVYPVGSQLPTEHELCERFEVSRYTVREALRRLRDDNLVASRPRAGTLVVPRPATNSLCPGSDVDQRPACVRNWRAVRDRVQRDGHDRRRTRRADRPEAGSEWLAVRGYRRAEGAAAPVCKTEYYINRAFAAVGRLLQRHSGPIFPLIEDLFGVSIVEVHQQIAAVPVTPELADALKVEIGHRRAGDAAHVQDVRR